MKNISIVRYAQYSISVQTGSLKESASGKPPTSRRSLNILIAQIACTIVDKRKFPGGRSLSNSQAKQWCSAHCIIFIKNL